MKSILKILALFLVSGTLSAQGLIESPFTPEPKKPVEPKAAPSYLLKTDSLVPNSYVVVYKTKSLPGPYRPYGATKDQRYSMNPPSVFAPGQNMNKLLQGNFAALKKVASEVYRGDNDPNKVVLVKVVVDQDGNVAAGSYYLLKSEVLDMFSVEVQEPAGEAIGSTQDDVLGAAQSE